MILNHKNKLALLIVSLPVVYFFLYVYTYAVNVPYMDDMELVDSVNSLKKDFSRWFYLLVRQQNDHRAMFPRLGILLTFLVKGTLDFRFTVLLGYLNLMALGWCFFLIHRSINDRISDYIPAAFLLFSPVVYLIHLWSLTAFQHTLSVVFSIACLYYLQPTRKSRWFYAIGFSVMATLTNLDGTSLLPVALLWLIAQARWKEALYYAAFAMLYLFVYFYDFKFSSTSNVAITADSLPLLAHCYLIMVGSLAKIVSDTHTMVLSAVFGGLMLLLFLTIKIRQYPGIRRLFDFDFTEIVFLRLLISMAVITIGRYMGGVENMVAMRFQIYSVSIAITMYFLLLKTLRGKALYFFRIASAFGAVAISLYSYVKYDSAVNYMEEGLKADSYNYPAHSLFLHQYYNLPDPDSGFYTHYEFPAHFSREVINSWKEISQKAGDKNFYLLTQRVLEKTGRYEHFLYPVLEFEIEGLSGTAPRKEAFLGIMQQSPPYNFYLVALEEQKGSWLKNTVSRSAKPVSAKGIVPQKLPAGNYSAILCWLEDGKPKGLLVSKQIYL
jgi:hypothetical protein